uniref:hypothetical protein n=1 Tax=Sahlingia subintegra TaxID=468936 RepID=UPI001FCD6CF3|nr:hypothetical protein MW427_pgp123 [Sahlingia subintegra]UNJ17303.1 hypothetical protein [Sahlingia subintegra]
METLTRYERLSYLRELVYFVSRYRTNTERFIQDNWQDQLIVSSGNDPISDIFNLETVPITRREIFPEQFKGIAHDLNSGRLLFGSSVTSDSFENSYSGQAPHQGFDHSVLVGGDYHKHKKSVNIPSFERWNILKKNRRTPNWFNANHRYLVNSLKFTPTFVPVNSFYHPILSIPPGDYIINALDKIYYFIFDWFVWEADALSLPIKKGFVFLNPEDAGEYINSVKEKSPRTARRYGPLQVFPVNLGLAYKWNRTSPPRLQFRFIPDVKEVGDLVYKYQYKKNITIHPSQIIKKDEFQGVPIYIIEPINIQDEDKKIKIDLNYKTSSKNKQKLMIFTSLDSLYKTWEKFCTRHSELQLPKEPTVQVYNLEDYLLDCETLLTNQCKNFRIVPSQDAYDFTMKNGHGNKIPITSYYYNYKLIPVVKRLKLWSRYFFWSMTTSGRPDW